MCHPKVFVDRSATALQGKFRPGFIGIFMHRGGLPLLFSYLLAASLVAGCSSGDEPANSSVATNVTAPSSSARVTISSAPRASVFLSPPATPTSITFIGAGDIASQNWSVDARHEQTAQLIEQAIAADPNTIVWTAGDNAYSSGTPTEFSSKYDPSWGRVRYRTYPVAGNHDWNTADAQGYLDYFCSERQITYTINGRPQLTRVSDCRFPGDVQRYWYSYNVGNNWHVIAIDSEYDTLDPTQEQYEWVKQDLQANTRGCIIAYWHHPRYASPTNHSGSTRTANVWNLLMSHGADIVLAGHNHNYERFIKQDGNGNADQNGMIQFTVGTGGAGLYSFSGTDPNSAFKVSQYGVLKLTLRDSDYDWDFIDINGEVLDFGRNEPCI
jgi:hypothetical protein